jgi:uncharacterized RDD family membrane protein YckC
MSACSKCGTANEAFAVFCQSCGTPVATSTTYGGFWIRVVAWLIDTLVVSAGTGIVVASTFGFGVVAVFFGHWLYEAFMISSSWQATLGKRAMNMVVTDMEGRPLSFAHATGRYFAKWLSALTFGIGFLLAAFTEKKQGLHDFVAGTVVVIKN